MKIVRVCDGLTYDGSQLRSHWIYETTGVAGDAVAWFVGPCQVAVDALVDLCDRFAGEEIRAAAMLHFLVEHFDPDLTRTVLRQRLLVAIAGETLRGVTGVMIERRADDLFVGERKLSVSIATVSPISGLIHLGINVDPTGAPVPAVGLAELDFDPCQTGEEIARRYAEEVENMQGAQAKVRWVW